MRNFSDREVSLETLSRLLWAAFGINRPDGAHRTAPSAKNAQEIDIYVALAQGLATVARGWVDRPTLAKAMELGPEQRVILAQSVGFPPD